MIQERDLRQQFEARKLVLAAWGQHVRDTVLAGLKAHLAMLPIPRDLDNFLKIPASCRVKDVGSFITKALHRGKPYTDPLAEITDQVGVRFVVLLSRDVEMFSTIIETEATWTAKQDRDYERERILDPNSFDYESNHFIVRPRPGLVLDTLALPPGISCEVQVRTLLQHAYAELSHDRLYKPECKVPDRVRRLVARGSALLETTDNMFCEVNDSLEQAIAMLRAGHDAALEVARARGLPLQGTDVQPSLALLRLWPAPSASKMQLDELLQRRDFIIRRMTERQSESIFYGLPVGLLGYLLVDRLGRDAAAHWPFDRELLDQVAGDLGVGLSG